MWPGYWTIENKLSDRDSYSWRYGRLSCRIWLTKLGMFYGQVDRWPPFTAWDFRTILDKMFNEINRNANRRQTA